MEVRVQCSGVKVNPGDDGITRITFYEFGTNQRLTILIKEQKVLDELYRQLAVEGGESSGR